ncbi:uncharacterized protein LOC110172034 isoform X1 [Boleophthalmus pectinirostris]|uniref:uncharacterized protein LOC110172034 isoform X1 n=2 Tax=Boleophthalmus pectinirostris TaxID=150288 RepID=UPI00242C11BB|nr:uncharacterized protein LOC110172034 isoform X1 [Boleophthalmus pectinirostris]
MTAHSKNSCFSRLCSDMKTDRELKRLFENLKEGPCGTEKITEHFEIHDVHRQRDAAEYLEFILNRLSPQASEIFRGNMSYSTKCPKGHIINEETNPFWTLPLPLTKDQNNEVYCVESGLERLFQSKMLKPYCNDCGENTVAEYKCGVKDLPQVLVLLLKRFVLDYSTGSHVKSNCPVDIPTSLHIKGIKYDLYGIVHHWGSLRSGHYTATIRSSETWYEFNDHLVQEAEEQPSEHHRAKPSDSAYLLAYKVSATATAIEILPDPMPPPRPTFNRRNVFLIVLGAFILLIILVLSLSLGLTQK